MRGLRRKLAFALLGVADWLYPSPGLGCLTNAQLDLHLARLKRMRSRDTARHGRW